MEQKQNTPEYGKNLGLSIDDYEKKMKNANIALIAGWIIGAIATIATIVLQVMAISYKGYYA